MIRDKILAVKKWCNHLNICLPTADSNDIVIMKGLTHIPNARFIISIVTWPIFPVSWKSNLIFYTPLKTNISPENWWFEDVFSF